MSPVISSPRLPAALAKGSIAPVWLVAGHESMLRDEAVATITDAVLDPSTRDFNLDIHSANQLTADALAGACATLPMMAERRVVVLRDLEAWKRKSKARQSALDYLQKPAVETVLILVQGGDDKPDPDFAKVSQVVDCSTPTGDALDAWLEGRLQAAGVKVTPAAREHLLRATIGDLGLLASEVGKLAGLGGGEAIDIDTVADLVGIRSGETVDDWRDAILADDTARALSLLPRVLEQSGVSGVRLVFVLGASLLAMRYARVASDSRNLKGRALSEAVKKLCFETRPLVGSYGPFAERVAAEVKRWPEERTAEGVRATLAADVALKSTTISDEQGILTDLILALATTGLRTAA